MDISSEEIVAAALEKFGEGVIHKMNEAEERRNREFSYQLKELEFYKNNYNKEMKSIFDDWFNYLQYLLIDFSKKTDEQTKAKYQRKINDFTKPENTIKLYINTVKYCGTETSKALALYSRITQDSITEKPEFAVVYVVCLLLATMKKEVLGQELDPMDLLQVFLTDYDENTDIIKQGQAYIEELWNTYYAK